MPKKLTLEECAALGVAFSCEQMDNGEYRSRLMKNGAGYILTEMPGSAPGAWQNSHYHQGVMETYIVQEGWIASAEVHDAGGHGVLHLQKFMPGQVFTTRPGIHHNIYMSSGTVIHTVKHGDCSLEKDWFASPKLDGLTKHLTEQDIRRRFM